MDTWQPTGWRDKANAQPISYPDSQALVAASEKLRRLPPLVTSFEIERLRKQIVEAQRGERFLLQGGDCAETLEDCEAGSITRKLKILLQMSMVLVHAMNRPVVRLGRFAGQFAKPRSSPEETRDGVTLPNYFGDLINRRDFSPEARKPDPSLLIDGYYHAALTLNFVRSLVDGGFADLSNAAMWDLSFLESANLSSDLRRRYRELSTRVQSSLAFVKALSEGQPLVKEAFGRTPFFTSHEALNLYYEEALARTVPRREGHYLLSTHAPWIGNRTRALNGAHVEFFRGIRNPLGVKVGSDLKADELTALLEALNPKHSAGRIMLITRFGAESVESALPPLVEGVSKAAHPVLWVCDPMHGNTRLSELGVKTRRFDDIVLELARTQEVLKEHGAHLGGLHVELTGDDVTECTGGAEGLTEADLARNYASACDPRLNYRQAMELSFALAELSS